MSKSPYQLTLKKQKEIKEKLNAIPVQIQQLLREIASQLEKNEHLSKQIRDSIIESGDTKKYIIIASPGRKTAYFIYKFFSQINFFIIVIDKNDSDRDIFYSPLYKLVLIMCQYIIRQSFTHQFDEQSPLKGFVHRKTSSRKQGY
jgi:2-hydroxy-3-keto-5-methylthiopentenyl-1-phosphate phosphatase